MTRAWPALALALAAALATPDRRQAAPAADRDRLRAALDAWRVSTGYPGASLGIVGRDGAVLALASGVADRASGRPLATDDLLLAGSVGKTFFAALAAQLIDEDRLALDAPVATYLPPRPWLDRIAHARAITVRQVMTHTSGLVRYELNPAFTAALRTAPGKTWTPEERLAFLFDAPPPFAPGEGWEYSDTNFIVLGMVLEAVTKTSAYDEIRRRFLKPLRLAGVVPVTARRVTGLVAGYAGPRDPLGLPDEVLVDGEFVVNPQFEWAGGGFATSAADLARWGHALYTGRALSARALAIMIDAAVPARLGPETRYGLGVIVRPVTPAGPTWGHSGFFPGYQTELVHVRDGGITLALQVNSSAPRTQGSRPLLRFVYDAGAMLRAAGR
jgi:D-alanyl-D-alanine carboxypeptidase